MPPDNRHTDKYLRLLFAVLGKGESSISTTAHQKRFKQESSDKQTNKQTGSTKSIISHFENLGVDCGTPTTPAHGDVTYNSTVYEAGSLFTCNKGYEVIAGTTYRFCTENGTWSGSNVTCSREYLAIEYVRPKHLWCLAQVTAYTWHNSFRLLPEHM